MQIDSPIFVLRASDGTTSEFTLVENGLRLVLTLVEDSTSQHPPALTDASDAKLAKEGGLLTLIDATTVPRSQRSRVRIAPGALGKGNPTTSYIAVGFLFSRVACSS